MADERKQSTAKPGETGVKDSVIRLLAILGLVTAVGGFGMLFSIWSRSGPPDGYETLRIASREYVNGNLVLAGELAEQVTLDPELEDDKPWIQLRLFLTSAAAFQRARETGDARERRVMLFDTIPLLQESAQAGYPPGRESEGQRYLGESLFEFGRFDEAAVAMKRAMELDPTLARVLKTRLAIAELKSNQSLPLQAFTTIESLLQDPSLDPMQIQAAEKIQVEALMELGRYQEAIDVIDRRLARLHAEPTRLLGELADNRDEFSMLRSVVEIRQAIDEFGPRGGDNSEWLPKIKAKLDKPLARLFDLQREASPRIAARSKIWSARALLCLGDEDLALTELTAVRQQRPFGAEASVGAIEEIEILAQGGRGLEMLQTTRYVVRELGDPRSFDSSLISFTDLRKRLSVAVEQLRQASEYKYAIDIARALPPIVDANEALLQEAMSYEEWADTTLRAGTNAVGEVSRSASKEARDYYRSAGDAYAASAKLDFDTPRYLESLWLAIDAYQKGRHFTRSVELLEPYLRYEERIRQSRGMVAYGRALLADGDAARAIQTLNECIIEFPRDPLRYDARLLAAQAYREVGNVPDAKRMLMDNLQDGELTPESPAWRDSLYTLGETSFQLAQANALKGAAAAPPERAGILRENQTEIKLAIRYLNEAVERYWPSERAQMASYLRSQAHVMASTWPREEAESPEILDAARRSLRAESEAELEAARQGFESLSRFLAQRQEDNRLSTNAERLLRNSLIFEADTLRAMKRLDEAIAAYRGISGRYINEPVSLEAMLGHARCARDLGRTREAEGLVRQAAVVLQRIQPELDAELARTTRYDRAGWEKLLTWMANRFNTNSNGA